MDCAGLGRVKKFKPAKNSAQRQFFKTPFQQLWEGTTKYAVRQSCNQRGWRIDDREWKRPCSCPFLRSLKKLAQLSTQRLNIGLIISHFFFVYFARPP